jgi:hypothetical protein
MELHREALLVDTHCDTLKCLMPMFTRPRDSQWDDRSGIGMGVRSSLGHIDFPRMRDGGVDCQVFAISSVKGQDAALRIENCHGDDRSILQ